MRLSRADGGKAVTARIARTFDARRRGLQGSTTGLVLACATLTWSERGGGAPGGGAASLVSEAGLTAMPSTSI